MKTAMQELIEHITKEFESIGYKININLPSYLEKEKEQMLNEWKKGFEDAKYIYNQNK